MHRGNETVLGERIRKYHHTVDTEMSARILLELEGPKCPLEGPLISVIMTCCFMVKITPLPPLFIWLLINLFLVCREEINNRTNRRSFTYTKQLLWTTSCPSSVCEQAMGCETPFRTAKFHIHHSDMREHGGLKPDLKQGRSQITENFCSICTDVPDKCLVSIILCPEAGLKSTTCYSGTLIIRSSWSRILVLPSYSSVFPFLWRNKMKYFIFPF